MTKEKLRKYLIIAAIVLAVIVISITYFFVLYKNQSIGATIANIVGILRPLTIGAILAYIMKSTCNFFEAKFHALFIKKGKVTEEKASKSAGILSVVLTYITWATAIGILLLIAIPQVIRSISEFANFLSQNIPNYINLINEWYETFLADQPVLGPYFEMAINELSKWSTDTLIPWISQFVPQLIPYLLGFITSIADIVIGLVISVFILSGRKILARKSTMLLHCIFKKDETVNAVTAEFKYADRMFSGFLEGKVLDSTIIAFIYYIVLSIIGVPYSALVAVICGVTNIIPIFGPFIGAIPSGVIILAAAPSKLLPFIIFVCVIQFIDGYIIDPHIVGGNIKMSSFCVVFAVILFGGLWGFMGLLLGVPTFAVIYDIVRKISIAVLKKQGKQDIIDKYMKDFGNSKRDKDKHSLQLGKKKKSSKKEPEQTPESESSEALENKDAEASDTEVDLKTK